MLQKSYKGLSNTAATCYINSLIQTLFMTPEFRDGIYGWTYLQKQHPAKADSILYQLQKLFARLELGCSGVNTVQLTKSFQWHDNQAFNQQDIQEFNRVLFEALQKSLHNSPSARLIKDLYEGELARFTKCLSCHHQSITHESFQDVILIVKDVYGRIYSDTLQLSLQRYIKPELLDEHNLYNCSACEQKVLAQRGVKFIRLPKLLNLVLQRFHFDYETFTRNKINDRLAFPFVLNFNNYNNGYEQIPNKLNEDSSDYFLKEDLYQKPTFVPAPRKQKVVSKSGTTASQPAVAGKVKTKPSANTKSFLQEMRKKKMQQALDNEDLVFVSGNATIHTQSQVSSTVTEVNVQPASNKLPEIPPPPPLALLHALDQPTLTTIYTPQIQQEPPNFDLTINKELQSLTAGKEKAQNQKQQKGVQLRQRCSQLIQQYLKDGPLVYELYSILVHSGTANAGHYFSYIKSPQNDKWYLFNDQRVTEINVAEIEKTFGGSGSSSAYVLYYRMVEEEKFKMEFNIPEYIARAVKEEEKEKEIKKIEKQQNLEHVLILKIYFQLGVRTIEIHKNSALQLLYEKARELFSIKLIEDYSQVLPGEMSTCLKPENLRLRLFNPANDTKLDTYTGKDQLSLFQLGIRSYNNLLLQVKADSQQFEEYVAGFMSVRVALWEENTKVVSLDEKDIKLHKVSIGRHWRMQEVEALLRQKRAEFLGQDADQNVCVIKRHQNDEYLYHQVINLPDYFAKTVDDVGIFQAEILFLEQDGDELNWPKEFQNEIHRITIKIVDKLETHNLLVDSRSTLLQLKQTLFSITGNLPQETIVRRGNRSGLELKNIDATLKENRFISGTTLFLEKGIPAKIGQVRIQLFLSSDASPNLYNRLHEFQFIADAPIDTNLKASEAKLIFMDLLNKTREIELAPNSFRIREKVNDKMGKIYREKPMKEQQIIEKREIAIEIAQDCLDPKDFSIYVRAWDQHNWKLSPKYEFLVNKNTTMQALAVQIHSKMHSQGISIISQPEDMDVCRILSIHKFSIIDLVDMEYFGMTSEACVLGQPLFVNADGLLYIVKQTGIEPRELTKEEEQLFGGKIRAIRPTRGRPQHHSTAVNPIVKKEKGITITVVEKPCVQQQKQ